MKISPLEAFKVKVVLDELVKKLEFLRRLSPKEEMSDQMSEEIQKAMDEQRNLEQRYANLVTRRSQLKGISNKDELAQVKEEILQVSAELKKQTVKLGRQLHDTPDTAGNTALIKSYRISLIDMLMKSMDEMQETQAFQDFKSSIDHGNMEKEKTNELKKQERELNEKIKKD